MAAITFREPMILVETVTKLVIDYLHVPNQVSSTLAGKKNVYRMIGTPSTMSQCLIPPLRNINAWFPNTYNTNDN